MKGLIILSIFALFLVECSLCVVVDEPVHTVIIGAGTAGIAAARELEDSGLPSYQVFEVSNRPFGRVHTIRKNGFDANVEMGAMWQQEVDRNGMVQLGDSYDIDSKKFDQGSVSVFTGGVLLTPEEVAAGVARYYAIKANATQYVALGVSNQQAFEMAGYMGDDPLVELCICFFDEQFFADNTMYHDSTEWTYYSSSKSDRIIPEGYDTLLQAIISAEPSIASKFNYNSKVVAVNATNPNGQAVVTYKKRVPQIGDVTDSSTLVDEDASDGSNDNNFNDETKWVTHTIEAREVVCSVPLMVLRTNQIIFDPPMPAPMRHAVDHLLAGVADKMVLYFDDDAGRKALKKIKTNYMMRTSFVVNPRINDCLMVFINGWQVYHEPIVLSFFQGDCARQMETMSDVVVKNKHMVALREIFSGSTLQTYLPDPINYKRTRWGSRKNYGMVYTTLGLNTTNDDLEALKQPFGANDNVHLIGEHAASPSNGYVHGAWNTGISVGQVIKAKEV